MTDVSGVRSSCDTVARKLDLTRSASCSRSTACARRRFFSVSSRLASSTVAMCMRADIARLMPSTMKASATRCRCWATLGSPRTMSQPMAPPSCASMATIQPAPSTSSSAGSKSGRASIVAWGGGSPSRSRPSRSITASVTPRSWPPATSVSRALRSRSSSSVTGASTLRAAFPPLMPASSSSPRHAPFPIPRSCSGRGTSTASCLASEPRSSSFGMPCFEPSPIFFSSASQVAAARPRRVSGTPLP